MFHQTLKKLQAWRGNLKFLLALAKPRPALRELAHTPAWQDISTRPSLSVSSISCVTITSPTGHTPLDSLDVDTARLALGSLDSIILQPESSYTFKQLRRVKHQCVQMYSVRTHMSTSNRDNGLPCANRLSRDELGGRTPLFQDLPSSCASRQRVLDGVLEQTSGHACSLPFAAFALETPKMISSPPCSKVDITSPKHLHATRTEDLPQLSIPDDILNALGPLTQLTNIDTTPYRSLEPCIPSVVLTCPTPNQPSSPIFVPRTPITVKRFISASSMLAATPNTPVSRPSPVPSLPKCKGCGLTAFETGVQCPECDKQWLACKIWYHANDGGRRQHLTEPYVLPGESTARNRALLGFLGVPGGNPKTVGLGLNVALQKPYPSSRWRRFVHSLPGSRKTLRGIGHSHIKESQGNTYLARGFLARPFSATISALKHVWKAGKNQLIASPAP